MNAYPESAVNVLRALGQARTRDRRKIYKLLSLDATPALAQIIAGEGENAMVEQGRPLLESVSQIVAAHRVRFTVADRTLDQYFREHPHAPRHLSLLGYFIDPRAAHGCGAWLLGRLVKVWQGSFPGSVFPVDEHCRVAVEAGGIDLSIQRDREDGKYAVVIENKIYGARNQPGQVQALIADVQKLGFDPTQIFVLHLALTDATEPDAADLALIRMRRVHYAKITYGNHVLKWMDHVLRGGDEDVPGSVRKNLAEYRSLVSWLIKRERTSGMNREILKQLEKAEQKGTLPSLSQVQQLRDSAEALKRCLESALRGRLLLRVMAILKQEEANAFFCLDGRPMEKIDFEGPYDVLFGQGVDLCVRVNDAARICFGAYPDGTWWFGYMRGGEAKLKRIEPLVYAEAEKQLGHIDGHDEPWYAWAWHREVDYENCQDESTAVRIARRLVKMRDSLDARLRNENAAALKPGKILRAGKSGLN